MSSLPKPPRIAWYKHWWVWLLIIFILIAAVGVVIQSVGSAFQAVDATSNQTITAAVRDLSKAISTNGKIAPEHSEQLAFSIGGKVSAVNVSVGDLVDNDEVLAKTSIGQQIKAPFDGRVLAVNTFVGNTATPGVAVFEVGYRSNFVDFVATESEVFDLATGQDVELTIPTYDNGAATYHGTIELVDTKKTTSSTISQTGSAESGYNVRIRPSDLPEEIGNLIGLTVNIKVLVDHKDQVLSVERAAVQYHEDDTAYVWVPSVTTDTAPIERNVTTGFDGDDYIEITSGLNAGETVVLNIPKSSSASVF